MSENQMQIGQIVEFFDENLNLCGMISGVKGKKLNVLISTDKEKSINISRVIHVSRTTLNPALAHQILLSTLAKLAEQRKELAHTISLREIWEVVQEESQSFEPQLLAELWFGGDVNDEQVAALTRLMYRDKIYFTKVNDGFIANSADDVERNLLRQQRIAQREQELHEAATWLKAVWDGKVPDWEPAARNEIIDLLKEVAIFENEAPNLKRYKDMMSRINITAPEAPSKILVTLGIWTKHENLLLHRLAPNDSWSSALIDEVVKLRTAYPSIAPNDYPERRDLTYLPAVSIDNQHTKDIDDAIHVETEAEHYRIGVHIADVAALVAPNSPLDLEALERGTSIYLPDKRIPMFHPDLSEDLFSLLQGCNRLTMTVEILVAKDGSVLEYTVYPSIINVKQRLSYEWVDAHLDEFPELKHMAELALVLRQKRIDHGATVQVKPDLELRINEDYEITLSTTTDQSPSFILVSELMILANSLFAKFLNDNDVPAIYRCQPSPAEPVTSMTVFNPLHLYRIRKLMTRADLSTEPAPHHGLGVDLYTTTTSPIRRYSDLLVQRQLHAACNPKTLAYSAEELSLLAARLEPLAQQANLLENIRFRYWLYRYLETKLGAHFPAVILERFYHKVRLMIVEFLLELEIPVPPSREFKAGQDVTVIVERVSAPDNHIFVRIVE